MTATHDGDQTYTYDTTARTVTTLQFFDTHNGKIDQIVVTFNETLAA